MIELSSWTARRRVGAVAWVTAWFALLVGQLHALSRFATEDGQEDLDLPLTGAWAEPAGDWFSPLLDWADPDVVYVTYGKIWAPVLAVLTLTALAAYQARRPTGSEKHVWRAAVLGYGLSTAALVVTYWTQWTGAGALVDTGLLVSLPGMLLSLVASTVLGVFLLRRGFRPRVAGWLLVASVPGLFLISQVTSLGSVILPPLFAMAIIGRRLASDPSYLDLVRTPAASVAA